MTQNNDNDISGKIRIKTCLKELEDEEGGPKPVSSTIHQIGGLSWRMEVEKASSESEGYLNLKVCCNEEVKDTLWLCKVDFSVRSGYAEDPDTEESFLFGPSCGFNTNYWILNNIFDVGTKEDYSDDEEDWLADQIDIKLNIKITRIQKWLPPFDTILMMKIGEYRTESFSINKHSLASFSNYFHNLFFGDWIDNRRGVGNGNSFEIVETEDFDVHAFELMVYSIMSMGAMMHESNFLEGNGQVAIKILKLSIKYDMAILFDYCENVLMECEDGPKLELLELAEQCSLNNLKDRCLNRLSIKDLTKDFAKTNDIYSRLSKNTQERLDAILAEKTNVMRNSLEKMDDAVRSKKPRLSSMADQIDKMKEILGHK